MCFNDVVRCVTCVEIGAEKRKFDNTSNHVLNAWGGAASEIGGTEAAESKLCTVQSSVRLFVSISRFILVGYSPCLKDYLEVANLIHNKPKLRNLLQIVYGCE